MKKIKIYKIIILVVFCSMIQCTSNSAENGNHLDSNLNDNKVIENDLKEISISNTDDAINTSEYESKVNLALGEKKQILLLVGHITNISINLNYGNYYLCSDSEIANLSYILKIGNSFYIKNTTEALRNIPITASKLEIYANPIDNHGYINILISRSIVLEEKYTTKNLHADEEIIYSISLSKGKYSINLKQNSEITSNTISNLSYSNDFQFGSKMGETSNNLKSKKISLNLESDIIIYIKIEIKEGGGTFELSVIDSSIGAWFGNLDWRFIITLILIISVNVGMIALFFIISKKKFGIKLYNTVYSTKLIKVGEIQSTKNENESEHNDEIRVE